MMTENETYPKNNRHRDKTYGWIQLALVLLFIGGAFLLYLYLSSLQTVPDATIGKDTLKLLVETTTAAPHSERLQFETTGTVQVRAQSNIVPQVSGRVVAIDDNAFPGGLFGPETVLFEIENTDFELEVERMEAEVARAKTQLRIQKANSETAIADWRQMHPDTPVPPLVAQEPQLEEARANLAAAESQIEMARLNLARTAYRLPYSGRITEFQIEEGQYVVAGQSYGSAYRLLSLEIDVPMEEQQFDWLMAAENPVISVSTDFSEKNGYSAFVKRVSARRDPRTRFARVALGLHDQAPDLVPDEFVNIRVIGPEMESVWVLPLDVLQENGRIWVITEEKELRALAPDIIMITDETVMMQSNVETIRAVRGSLPEATENTPVELTGKSDTGAGTHGRRQ